MKIKHIIFTMLTLCALLSWGQGTIEDYKRTFSAPGRFSNDKVHYAPMNTEWIKDSHKFWFRQYTPQGIEYVWADADHSQTGQLINTKDLAAALTQQLGQTVNNKKLHLDKVQPNESLDTIDFRYAGFRWRYMPIIKKLTRLGPIRKPEKKRHWMEIDDELNGKPITSPDGTHTAYIQEYNLYVRQNATGRIRQLSNDGTRGNYYSCYLQWSPDGTKILTKRIRPAIKRYVYYVESSPKDQLHPKLHKQEYAKPGDELRFCHHCIFNVQNGMRLIPDTELFAKPYDITHLRWTHDGKAVTFEYNERGHKVYRLLEMNAFTGQVRTIIEERHDKYVNYPRLYRYFMNNGKEMIWTSERDNWNHLYLIDCEKGTIKQQITKGQWYVRDVLFIDEGARQIYFTANGMNGDKEEDPYLIRYYRIGMDGKGLQCLTPEKGMHQAVFSSDRNFFVDTYSLPDSPPVTIVRRTSNGKPVMPAIKADISKLLAEGWRAPEVFSAPGRDGETPMWGIIYRPSNFDPGKTYPIIEYIYAGPGDQYVPKTFSPYNWWMQGMAELGFIVVQVDGMGTSFRSRQFENICYKNLKDGGFPDRIAWIKAAANRYPQMDTTRVGIFGSSAGGQESTAAVLFHPEFYKAAYSACGCHDNRMDKIWWNELWMGYPIDSAYIASSNVENAHRLQGALMLVVGEVDDNVDPASTMQLVNALIKANKNFELVVIPGAGHTMGELYGDHKRYDFFVRNLMEKNPPKWNNFK